MEKIKPTCFQIYIALKILDECEPFSNIVPKIKLRKRLVYCHIPLKLHKSFLKDLEDFGFIKNDNRLQVIVNKEKINEFKEKDDWF